MIDRCDPDDMYDFIRVKDRNRRNILKHTGRSTESTSTASIRGHK